MNRILFVVGIFVVCSSAVSWKDSFGSIPPYKSNGKGSFVFEPAPLPCAFQITKKGVLTSATRVDAVGSVIIVHGDYYICRNSIDGKPTGDNLIRPDLTQGDDEALFMATKSDWSDFCMVSWMSHDYMQMIIEQNLELFKTKKTFSEKKAGVFQGKKCTEYPSPEDEEDSITIHQSDIIPFEDETNYEIDLFSIKGLESTNEESVILNEKSDQVKEENEKCLDNTKK